MEKTNKIKQQRDNKKQQNKTTKKEDKAGFGLIENFCTTYTIIMLWIEVFAPMENLRSFP